MIELAVILLRFIQYSTASVLMGSALFFFYALPARGAASGAELRWARPLVAGAAVLLALAAIGGLIAQTAVLAGSLADALTRDALSAVVNQMDLGKAALARAALGLTAAISVGLAGRGRASWLGAGLLGAMASATFGWMGHGAATDGGGRIVHLAADVLHALAAAAWIGALVVFAGLTVPKRQDAAALAAIARALESFSPIGIALVATLVLTGLVNTWYIVGLHVAAAVHDRYGQLLALKLTLFAGMLALAAFHRQRAVPALAAQISARLLSTEDALASLRRSIAAEAVLGFAVLGLVGWFGMLEPPGPM